MRLVTTRGAEPSAATVCATPRPQTRQRDGRREETGRGWGGRRRQASSGPAGGTLDACARRSLGDDAPGEGAAADEVEEGSRAARARARPPIPR
eukprot:scaffold604_cov384-Prasinococcus_capsulatus_cf.AAC.18